MGRAGSRSTVSAAAALALVLSTAACTLWEAKPQPGPETVSTAPDPVRVMDVVQNEEVVPAGRYMIEFEGADPNDPVAVVSVPAGFTINDESLLWKDSENGGNGGVTFWKVAEVARNPCKAARKQDSRYYDPGPTVQDLADSLTKQAHRVATTKPRPVTLAGYHGLYLELRFDKSFDVEKCLVSEGWAYEAWRSNANADHARETRWKYLGESVDRLWILDVNGRRLVVNEMHGGAETVPENQGMVQSLEFLL
jgi:hypothetical protein